MWESQQINATRRKNCTPLVRNGTYNPDDNRYQTCFSTRYVWFVYFFLLIQFRAAAVLLYCNISCLSRLHFISLLPGFAWIARCVWRNAPLSAFGWPREYGSFLYDIYIYIYGNALLLPTSSDGQSTSHHVYNNKPQKNNGILITHWR